MSSRCCPQSSSRDPTSPRSDTPHSLHAGELALLSTDKRAATVSSVEKTTVLTLGRVQFTRLLGPLKDIMAAADQGRK